MKKIKFILQLALLIGVLSMFSLANNSNAAGKTNPCKKYSSKVLKADKFAAKNDYWLDLSKCDNIPIFKEMKTCQKKANKNMNEEINDSKDQYKGRLKVCEALGGSAYNPTINPSDFVDKIDNQYFPLTPGTTFIYEAQTEEGTEHIEVHVTNETKVILGVTCVVVKDTVTANNEVVEDTLDWYAQDKDGNVWYFGEESKGYENGELVTLEGSWKAGVDGAKPGIIMKANPEVGNIYRQEFAPGEAEDIGEVLSLNESVTVSGNSYNNCLQTKDFTAMDPDVVEHKFYAPGVGVVKEETVKGGTELVELVEIKTE